MRAHRYCCAGHRNRLRGGSRTGDRSYVDGGLAHAKKSVITHIEGHRNYERRGAVEPGTVRVTLPLQTCGVMPCGLTDTTT